MKLKSRVKITIPVILCILLIIGSGVRTDRYFCNVCFKLKRTKTFHILWFVPTLTFSEKEEQGEWTKFLEGKIFPGHDHKWLKSACELRCLTYWIIGDSAQLRWHPSSDDVRVIEEIYELNKRNIEAIRLIARAFSWPICLLPPKKIELERRVVENIPLTKYLHTFVSNGKIEDASRIKRDAMVFLLESDKGGEIIQDAQRWNKWWR